MVAYNFQKQFAASVATGQKRQTIRAERKRHARVGEPVQLYTGMRTKVCRKLVDPDPICTDRRTVAITEGAAHIDNRPLHAPDAFAQADGFNTFAEMRDWFKATHGLPFIGQLICWESDKDEQ